MAEEECISPFNEGRRKFVKPKLDQRRELVNIAQEVSKVMQAQDHTMKTGAATVSIPFLNSWNAAKRKKQTSEYEMKLNALDKRMQKLESELHLTPPSDAQRMKKIAPTSKGKISLAPKRYRKSVFPKRPTVPDAPVMPPVAPDPTIPQTPKYQEQEPLPDIKEPIEEPEPEEDEKSPPDADVARREELPLLPLFRDFDDPDSDDDEDEDSDEDDSDS